MASNVRVLLVDDNPMVLGMLREALANMAIISTAADGADALLRIIDEPFDLIISDYQMPGMDGRALFDKIRARAATSRIPFILIASKGDIADKLKALQDKLEEVIEKPFFIKDAAARIKRVIDKIALEKLAREAPTADGKLRGSLAQMNVMDLLQSLDLAHKSCLLTLTNDGDRCEMYFKDGQINHAVYGSLQGNEAVFKVLSWTGGNFQIDFSGHSDQQSISHSTQGLLMEGLRLLDEANKEAEDNVLEA